MPAPGTTLEAPDSATQVEGPSRVLRSAAWAVLDRGLHTASMLALTVAFLSWSDTKQFGEFLIARNLALLPLALHSAVVLTPMQVLIPSELDRQRQSELISGFRSLSNSLACLAALCLLPVLLSMNHLVWQLSLGAVVLSISLTIMDRARMESYSVLRSSKGFLVTATYASVLLALLPVLVRSSIFHATSAVWAMAIASLLAAGGSGAFLGHGSRKVLLDAVRRIRPYLGWLTAGAMLAWLQVNLYMFGAFHIGQSEGVGQVGMARTVLLPISLLGVGFGLSLRPRLAVTLTHGSPIAVLRQAGGLSVITATLGAAYCAIVKLLVVSFGAHVPYRFLQSLHYVDYWLVDAAAILVFAVGATVLVAARSFKILTWLSLVAVSIGYMIAFGFARSFGPRGVLVGQIAADATLAILVGGAAIARVLKTPQP